MKHYGPRVGSSSEVLTRHWWAMAACKLRSIDLTPLHAEAFGYTLKVRQGLSTVTSSRHVPHGCTSRDEDLTLGRRTPKLGCKSLTRPHRLSGLLKPDIPRLIASWPYPLGCPKVAPVRPLLLNGLLKRSRKPTVQPRHCSLLV